MWLHKYIAIEVFLVSLVQEYYQKFLMQADTGNGVPFFIQGKQIKINLNYM